jgi:hypothetical protein
MRDKGSPQERGLQTGTMGAICTPILAFVSIFASIKASLGRIRTSNSATKLELQVMKRSAPQRMDF